MYGVIYICSYNSISSHNVTVLLFKLLAYSVYVHAIKYYGAFIYKGLPYKLRSLRGFPRMQLDVPH